MTVGVVWEFFEFSMDQFFLLDMQKDFVVQEFGSVALDPANIGIREAKGCKALRFGNSQ